MGFGAGSPPRGDLRVEFFFEAESIPSSGTMVTAPDGSVSERPNKEKELTRTMQVGVVIAPQHIPSFARWLNEESCTNKSR